MSVKPLSDDHGRSGRLDFSVLGSLEVRSRGMRLALGGRKQQILLGMLLCRANELVALETLMEAIWGDAPPRTAEQNLRVYVYHLRNVLGSKWRIIWRAHGYGLVIQDGELDAHRFAELAARGRRALEEGSPRAGISYFNEALSLWRGPALMGLLDVEPLRSRAVLLDEQRLGVLEARAAAELALGRHSHVIGELQSLAAEYPLREHLQAQLMVALYRSGRRAEALAVYRTTRRILVNELGVEPGTRLRQLHQGILSDDARICDTLFPLSATEAGVNDEIDGHAIVNPGRSELLRDTEWL
jgi:DNA-binding SARP family transcriptional activator